MGLHHRLGYSQPRCTGNNISLHNIITYLTHSHGHQVPLHHGAALEIQDLAKRIQDQGGSLQVDVMEKVSTVRVVKDGGHGEPGVQGNQGDQL